MERSRIGIFGGTFNPVHVGHVRAAIEVAEALDLPAVEFVPAARPPHKTDVPMLDFELRLRLCHLAVDAVSGFSVNPMEADRPGPSYTCETLASLDRDRPDMAFYFIMGMVDLHNLPLWKNGLSLGRWANLAVHAREGLGIAVFTEFMTRNRQEMAAVPTADPAVWTLSGTHSIHFVPVTRLDVSASDIRKRWLEGRRIEGLVPDAVLRELTNQSDTLEAVWGRRCVRA